MATGVFRPRFVPPPRPSGLATLTVAVAPTSITPTAGAVVLAGVAPSPVMGTVLTPITA